MQKGNTRISMAVIRRLPKYRRYLSELLDKDIHRISSKELSKIIGFTASQIRQDLNNFGGFGQQGYGYNVEELHSAIGKILGLDHSYNTVIVGAGNIGQAIANYTNFEKAGFKPTAMFEINPKLIGLKIRDIEIMDADLLGTYIKEKNINIGIICTSKEKAQDVANVMVESGIQGIWNFAPTDLQVPEHVVLETVHLSESLYTLSYLLKHKREEED
ncbi:redox-sensing transcriptional repressor Rex [Anaeromicrobium sediminis]|uniref:Redox-sensing transcriptional repressor Rex n=1 Tax=Anaeromicrobium sediminis TaxID=1478221 RepID=A0A267MKC8_9FIRM|nr:redox-sensing transcriptional repressor Rex [Anaeromicrobium sediminis]